METRIEMTGDGSHTLYVPSLGEHYHSTFGAIRESEFIFIRSGYETIDEAAGTVHILEMGFGTGLNALLTCNRSKEKSRKVHYTAVEKFPLQQEITNCLNYPGILDPGSEAIFRSIHDAGWNRETMISDTFTLLKLHADMIEIPLASLQFDLVYYDAFGPDVQPELWTAGVFEKIARSVNPGGILVTYSAKGSVRRALQASGFSVEKLPGPPGKREITRATKQKNKFNNNV